MIIGFLCNDASSSSINCWNLSYSTVAPHFLQVLHLSAIHFAKSHSVCTNIMHWHFILWDVEQRISILTKYWILSCDGSKNAIINWMINVLWLLMLLMHMFIRLPWRIYRLRKFYKFYLYPLWRLNIKWTRNNSDKTLM